MCLFVNIDDLNELALRCFLLIPMVDIWSELSE